MLMAKDLLDIGIKIVADNPPSILFLIGGGLIVLGVLSPNYSIGILLGLFLVVIGAILQYLWIKR